MKIETAVNMAVTAVVCDMRLPQEMKKEIIDGLREAERLAELGTAVETAALEGSPWIIDTYSGINTCPNEEDIKTLISWYRGEVGE